MIPVAWLLLAMLAMWLSDRYVPLVEVFARPFRLPGQILILAGAGWLVTAAWQFRRAKTSVAPFAEASALITGGPFRLSRNPIYLGMTLMLCGAAMQLGSLTPWLVVPVFVWIIQVLFIVGEEQRLAGKFPREFEAYCARVRRWI